MRLAILAAFTTTFLTLAASAAPADRTTDEPLDANPDLLALRQLVLDGHYPEAEQRARELIAEYETDGAETTELAQALMYLSQSLWRGGRIFDDETLETALRSVRIQESVSGPDSPELSDLLMNLAGVYWRRSELGEARRVSERQLAILQGAGLANDYRAAGPHNILSLVLWFDGDLDGSLVHMRRTVDLLEAEFGHDHSQVAMMIQNMGWIESQQGAYEDSRTHLEDAAAIWRRIGLTEHAEYARCLILLAMLDWYEGHYPEARREYETALHIQEQALGPDHPDLAHSLSGLGRVYRDTGDLEGAAEFYERAIAIREAALGQHHYDVVWDYFGYAEVLIRQGASAEARAQLDRAIEITGDPEDGTVLRAVALTRLAALDAEDGDGASARVRAEEALAILERENLRWEIAQVEHVLGALALESCDAALAADHQKRATSLAEAVAGEDHPAVAWHLAAWSEAAYADGRIKEAFELAMRAEAVSREHLRETSRWYEENQALKYAESRMSGLDLALSCLSSAPAGRWAARTLDAVIRSRALVFDEIAGRQLALRDADDPEVANLRAELAAARDHLANVLVRGTAQDPARHQAAVAKVTRERDEAERRLAERSVIYRTERERLDLGLDDIRLRLEPNKALISYVGFIQRSPGMLPETTPSLWAFVLRGDGADPTGVLLTDWATLREQVLGWRYEATQGELDPARSPRQAENAYRETGDALRALVWDPLTPYLKDVDRAYLVLEGDLHLINFGALPLPDGRYLIEDPLRLEVLTTERDLVPRDPHREGTGLLAMGDPAFDVPPDLEITSGSDLRSSPSRCRRFSDLRFDSLPGTRQEVDEILAIWDPDQASTRMGPAATEHAFKEEAPGHRVLHLATHGFFLEDRCPQASTVGSGEPHDGAADELNGSEGTRTVWDENPLLLSGLALAGANQRSSTSDGEEDGILTSEEILALDLGGVDLAVLSACDTGLGKIEVGEGVLGLRRAFLLAGAESLVMSLWAVEDTAARLWMTALYQQRAREDGSTTELVRQASLERLRDRRSRGESTHPFYWGAFVAVGTGR